MAGVDAGKPFTNLKIEVVNSSQPEEGELEEEPGETKMEEDEMEEGEASDDEVEVNVILRPPDAINTGDAAQVKWPEKSRSSSAFEPSPKSLSERVRRFGTTDPPKDMPSPEAVIKLYRSLGVTSEDFARGHYLGDALVVRGMGQLSSREVLKYFQEYHPSSVEWIDKNTCNVVWLDKVGATRALLGLSCPIIPRRKDTSSRSANGRKTQGHGEGRGGAKVKKEKKDLSKSKKSISKGDSSSSSSSSSSGSDSSSSDSSSSDSEGSSSSSSSSSRSSSCSSSSSSSDSGSESEGGKKEKKAKKKKKKPKIKVEKMDEDMPAPKKVPGGDEEGSVREEEVNIKVPSGRWRLGVPCQRTKAVLMRYSSRSDRKDPQGPERLPERIVDPYRNHYNPIYGGKGLLSESARQRMRLANRIGAVAGVGDLDDVGGPEDWRGDLDNPKNPWGALAQNWGRKESQEDDEFNYLALLQQHRQRSMGVKRKREDSASDQYMSEDEYYRGSGGGGRRGNDKWEEEHDSDDSDVVPWKSKIKFPRMKMYADAEQKKTKRKKSGDLRNRLSEGGRGRQEERSRRDIKDRLSHRKGNQGIKSRLDLRAKLSRKKRRRDSVKLESDRYYRIMASDED